MTENSVDVTIREVLAKEIKAIELVAESDFDHSQLVQAIHACRGKVIFTGMGKSGLIARKISATFSSTATPSNFIHPAEALHGDIGTIGNDDFVFSVSNSGETEELLGLLPFLRRRKIPFAAMTCNPDSTLALKSDFLVSIPVDFEADPFSLVPTCTTTAMLAMGDALGVAILNKRNFTREQFAELHPSGSLGRKLLLYVADIMHVNERVPTVVSQSKLRDTVCRMGEKKLGAAFIVDALASDELLGVFTDGDLRRLLEVGNNPLDLVIDDVMTRQPTVISSERLAVDAVEIMQAKKITILPVVDQGCLVGAIHLHDLLKAGLG